MSSKVPQLPVNDEVSCLEDVKNETGFDSYRSYLDEYYGGMPRLARFIGGDAISSGSFIGNCAIFDITETGSLSTTLDVRLEHLSPGFTEILACLRNPPSDSVLRVLLLEPKDHKQRLPWSLMDVIGLGLRISPDLLEAYLSVNPASEKLPHRIPLRASHGAFGRGAFTISRDYLPHSPSCPPVLVVLGHPAPSDARYPGFLLSSQTAPFASSDPLLVRHRGPLESPWPCIFKQLFCSNIQNNQRRPLTFDELLVHSLLPLLETCLERLKGAFDEALIRYRKRVGTSSQDPIMLWTNALEDHENEMEEVRYRLRRWIGYYERILNHFSSFLRMQGVSNPQHYEAFSIIGDDSKCCLEDAHSLEAELRDWLQLRVGSLALQESKKSIQLSNLQMEEAKRGMVPLFKSLSCLILTNSLLNSQDR